MAFKEQCLYWHNYFRTLHQVNSGQGQGHITKSSQLGDIFSNSEVKTAYATYML